MEVLLGMTLIIVGVAVLLLSVGILLRGHFVNTHVSGNKVLQRCGIHCASAQDVEARMSSRFAVAEHVHEVPTTSPVECNDVVRPFSDL